MSRERTGEEQAETIEPPRVLQRKFATASVSMVGAARTGWADNAAKRIRARGPKGIADYVARPAADQCLQEQCLEDQCLGTQSGQDPPRSELQEDCNERGELQVVCSKRAADSAEKLRELLELHDSGESVVWANGMSAKKARLQLSLE